MEIKFTPWRMAYIGGAKSEGCVFCEALAANDDAARFIVARETLCFVILNIFPYNNGHVMVVPNRHIADLADLTTEEAAAIMHLTSQSVRALRQSMHPQGFNVGLNLGTVAGAGIADHLHEHIVPRWNGDTNFMAAIAGTRLIPQSLQDTWQALRDVWNHTA